MCEAHFYLRDPNAPKAKCNSIGVCVAVLFEDTVLLEHRADNDSWGFIGGAVEIEETLRQGAARELREETGIIVEPARLALLDFFDDPMRIAQYPDGNIIRLLTAAFSTRLHTLPALVCSAESRALAFTTKDDLLRLHIVPTHRDVLERFLQAWPAL